MLTYPKAPWRILTSEDHSTVWDGADRIFDLNFYAFRCSGCQAFEMAGGSKAQLPIGELMDVPWAYHYSRDLDAAA